MFWFACTTSLFYKKYVSYSLSSVVVIIYLCRSHISVLFFPNIFYQPILTAVETSKWMWRLIASIRINGIWLMQSCYPNDGHWNVAFLTWCLTRFTFYLFIPGIPSWSRPTFLFLTLNSCHRNPSTCLHLLHFCWIFSQLLPGQAFIYLFGCGLAGFLNFILFLLHCIMGYYYPLKNNLEKLNDLKVHIVVNTFVFDNMISHSSWPS